MFKNALWTAFRTIFRSKIAGFCRHNLNQVAIPPDDLRNRPGDRTQTPISACLSSVPILPVLRNDHCSVLTGWWHHYHIMTCTSCVRAVPLSHGCCAPLCRLPTSLQLHRRRILWLSRIAAWFTDCLLGTTTDQPTGRCLPRVARRIDTLRAWLTDWSCTCCSLID